MTGRKQSIAEGALILTLAIAIVKIVGAIYKFPLIARLAGGGWGYYQTSYNIYSAIYAVAVTGFPSAVSRMVAAAYAEGRYRDCLRIRETALKLFTAIGLAGCLGLMVTAKWLTGSVMENPNCYYAVLAVAPSLIFSGMMAAYTGYYQGMSNMVPTAISEVVQVLFKATFSYGAAVLLQRALSYEYASRGTVLGVPQIESTVASAILSVCAAGAIAGVSVSTFAGWVAMRTVYKKNGCLIPEELLSASPEPTVEKGLAKELLRMGLALALSSVTLRMASLIDNVTVIRCLNNVIAEDLPTLYASHGGLFSQIDVEVADLANYLYEVYGYGLPFFDLIPTIAATFSTSALPHITAAYSVSDQEQVGKHINSTLNITMLIAAPAGLGLAFMAKPVLDLIYPNLPVGAALAAPMLSVLGVAAVFSCLTSSVNTMMHAVGKIHIPVILMAIGCAVKIAVNYVFVSIPTLNIKAAPLGNLCCYGITAIAGLVLLIHYSGVKVSFFRCFLKPLLGGLAAGLSARLVYDLMAPVFGKRIPAVVGIAVAVVLYGTCALLFSFISKEEMLTIPGLKKLVPYLEKFGLLK